MMFLFRKKKPLLLLWCALQVLPQLSLATEANSWLLKSPEDKCEISVFLEGGHLHYQASRDGKIVIAKSPLGLHCSDEDFNGGLRLDHAEKARTAREEYELFAGVQPKVNHLLNFRHLVFRNPHGVSLGIDLAASDEGVAFRYQFSETNPAVRVAETELTGFALPMNASGWLQPYHAAGPYTPAYEDFYFPVSPGDRPPDSRQRAMGWAFPALFQVTNAASWVLLSEAGTDESFCGCHLGADSSDGIYKIAFPLADENTHGHTNNFRPEPRFTLPWTMPWRVMVMGQSAGDIATSTLITDLAAPSRIADTTWIRPGRSSWAWWSYPDGPATKKMFDEFSDFAARMGWEYTLFDAGWAEPGLEPIALHAQSEGVRPLAWLYAGDFYDAAAGGRLLDKMTAAGVKGVKVDFWCSDRQEAIAAQQSLLKEAAERKLVVNLHGCTIPRGQQRTWPNFLTCEAVLGSESYFYEPRYTEKAAELDTVLPFTRNAVGPMDLTPVACTPKKFARTVTAAHQLAAALIFTSGIIHYADKPEFFESLPPPARQIFRDAPARWDETRCLIGEPGRMVVFARRSAQSWYLAGLNGTTNALAVTLDLAPYKKYRNRIAITEGADANLQVTSEALGFSSQWQHLLPPRGGFILRFDK